MILSLFDGIVDSMQLTPRRVSKIPTSIEEVQTLLNSDSFEFLLITRFLLHWTQLSLHIDVKIAVGEDYKIYSQRALLRNKDSTTSPLVPLFQEFNVFLEYLLSRCISTDNETVTEKEIIHI